MPVGINFDTIKGLKCKSMKIGGKSEEMNFCAGSFPDPVNGCHIMFGKR